MPSIVIVGGAVAQAQFVTSAVNATDLTTYTFASTALGSEASDRRIVVAVASRANAARTLNSVSVAGVAASEVITQNVATFGADIASLWIATVATGATGDIVVTFSAAMVRSAIHVFRVTGASSSTAHDTASDVTASSNAFSTTIDVPARGFAIAHLYHSVSAGTASATWSGLTERSDENPENTANGTSTAMTNFSSTQTGLAVTGTSAGTVSVGALVAASWGT